MDWLFGIYLVVGVFKTLARLGEKNPAKKPVWMSIESNPLKLALYFTLTAFLWPFVKR